MGRKIDALLGRSFKHAKFKLFLKLAMTRLSVVKNQRQVRFSQARSDVVQLLNLGHHERALLRVEQVIKEQNMVDVYFMMEGYFLQLTQRLSLIDHQKECPEELKEAISSLLYVSSRCGELPELQQIRVVLTSRYGKEFAARAIELRNNCGVNLKVIQKLSTRMPDLDSRMNTLKQIASQNGIILQLDDTSDMAKDNLKINQEKMKSETNLADNLCGVKVGDGLEILPDLIEKDERRFSGVFSPMRYRDATHAAQVAFESAAYAAVAAKAAMELYRSDSHDPPDDHNTPHSRIRNISNTEEFMKFRSESVLDNQLGKYDKSEFENVSESADDEIELENVVPGENENSESGHSEVYETNKESTQRKDKETVNESSSVSSDNLNLQRNVIAFDGSDDGINVNKQQKNLDLLMKYDQLISIERKGEELAVKNKPVSVRTRRVHIS